MSRHKHDVSFFSNIVELNPVQSDLHYFSHLLSRDAKIVTILEFVGDLCSVEEKSYSREAPAIYRPVSNKFGNKYEVDIKSYLGKLAGPKILTIFSSTDINFALDVYGVYNPDLVMFDDSSTQERFQSQFLPESTVKFAGIPLPGRFSNLQIEFIGNNYGYQTVLNACHQLDNFYKSFNKTFSLNLDFLSVIPRIGFYGNEYDGISGWAWSGPTNSALFYLPVMANKLNIVSIFFPSDKFQIFDNAVEVIVSGYIIQKKISELENKLSFELTIEANRIYVLVEIRYDDGVLTDRSIKRAGIAVSKVKIVEAI